MRRFLGNKGQRKPRDLICRRWPVSRRGVVLPSEAPSRFYGWRPPPEHMPHNVGNPAIWVISERIIVTADTAPSNPVRCRNVERRAHCCTCFRDTGKVGLPTMHGLEHRRFCSSQKLSSGYPSRRIIREFKDTAQVCLNRDSDSPIKFGAVLGRPTIPTLWRNRDSPIKFNTGLEWRTAPSSCVLIRLRCVLICLCAIPYLDFTCGTLAGHNLPHSSRYKLQ